MSQSQSSIRITTLANGLRVVTDTMPDAESVVVGTWVASGTRDEAREANGVAHLVEHMMFKGTKTRSAFDLSKAIENNGGSMNAHTTREETAYYARVLPEDTALALDIIADMLQHSIFDAKELEREKQVIIQEIGRDIDTPEDHLFDLMHQKAYPRQRLGRSILGTAKVIEAMPRRAAVDYVKAHYNAATMVVIAVGRVEHEAFVTVAKKFFGKLPAGKRTRLDQSRAQGGATLHTKDSEQLHLILGFVGQGMHDKNYAATQVLATLLGGSASSRLFQKIREKRGLVYSISAMHEAFTDSGIFQIYAGTDPDRIRELIPVLCREVVDVTKTISKAELARAKAQIRADILMGRESVMRRADMLGHHMVNFGRPLHTTEMLTHYDAVTREDAEQVARQLLSQKPILAAIGPLHKLESYEKVCERLAV